MDSIEIRILGGFEVLRGNRVLASGGGKRHALLAGLLLTPNETVRTSRLIDLIWGDEPATSAWNLVQGYVSDWRSLLNPDRSSRSSGGRLESAHAGYRLRVDVDECDLLRFRKRWDEAQSAYRRGDLQAARTLLAGAVAERRGAPLGDFDSPGMRAAAAAMDAACLSAIRLSADVEMRLDQPDRAVELLAGPIDEYPLREDLVELAVAALYRMGRQADALALFERTRHALSEELGVDPGPGLVRLHVQILRQDPRLRQPARPVRRPPLPAPMSPILGRDVDSAAVLDLLRRQRLVTLTGPGGCGKSRLALEVLQRRALSDAPLTLFVDAVTITTTEEIWPAAAAAFGSALGPRSAPESLAERLPSEPSLLVLDNVEHLIGLGPQLVSLLRNAPQLTVLATSRTALEVRGEQVFVVPPLPVPVGSDLDLEHVHRSPSVQLLLDRARAAGAVVEPTERDATTLAQIVRRLDGLPLAVELAAPWLRTLNLDALLDHLDRPFDVLVAAAGSSRGSRHGAMRDVIAWTYDSLSQLQRTVIDQLAVFVSGAELDTLRVTTELGDNLSRPLSDLVLANLVTRVPAGQQTRYRLLEIVRRYALDELGQRPADAARARAAHAAWVSRLAEEAARAMGSAAADALTVRVAAEQSEIRAALDYFSTTATPQRELEVAVDCRSLWWDLGHIAEGLARIRSLLSHPALREPTDTRAAAMSVSALLAEASGDSDSAIAFQRELIVTAQRCGNVALEVLGQEQLGNALAWSDFTGDAAEGRALLAGGRKRAARLSAAPQRWGWLNRTSVIAFASSCTVDVLRYRDPAQARRVARSFRDESMRVHDSNFAAFAVRAVGFLDADAGNWDPAESALLESLTLASRSGSERNQARTWDELARLAFARGDLDEADALAMRATAAGRDAGNGLIWSKCATLLSDIRMSRDRLSEAEAMLDEAERARPRHPGTSREVGPYRARLARLRGDPESAAWYLATSAELERAEPLWPARVVYLIEAAHQARAVRDEPRCRLLVSQLLRIAADLGLPITTAQSAHLPAGSIPDPESVQNPMTR